MNILFKSDPRIKELLDAATTPEAKKEALAFLQKLSSFDGFGGLGEAEQKLFKRLLAESRADSGLWKSVQRFAEGATGVLNYSADDIKKMSRLFEAQKENIFVKMCISDGACSVEKVAEGVRVVDGYEDEASRFETLRTRYPDLKAISGDTLPYILHDIELEFGAATATLFGTLLRSGMTDWSEFIKTAERSDELFKIIKKDIGKFDKANSLKKAKAIGREMRKWFPNGRYGQDWQIDKVIINTLDAAKTGNNAERTAGNCLGLAVNDSYFLSRFGIKNLSAREGVHQYLAVEDSGKLYKYEPVVEQSGMWLYPRKEMSFSYSKTKELPPQRVGLAKNTQIAPSVTSAAHSLTASAINGIAAEETDASCQYYDDMTKLNMRDYIANMHLGNCKRREGEMKEAEKAFAKAIEILTDPKFNETAPTSVPVDLAEVYYKMALCQNAMGRKEAAYQYLSRSIELADSDVARLARADIYAEESKWDEALAEYETVANMGNTDAAEKLISILVERGEADRAISYFIHLKIISNKPMSAKIEGSISKAYLISGDIVSSQRHHHIAEALHATEKHDYEKGIEHYTWLAKNSSDVMERTKYLCETAWMYKYWLDDIKRSQDHIAKRPDMTFLAREGLLAASQSLQITPGYEDSLEVSEYLLEFVGGIQVSRAD